MDPRASFPLAAACKKWAGLPQGIQKMIKLAAWPATPSAKAFKRALKKKITRSKKDGDTIFFEARCDFGKPDYRTVYRFHIYDQNGRPNGYETLYYRRSWHIWPPTGHSFFVHYGVAHTYREDIQRKWRQLLATWRSAKRRQTKRKALTPPSGPGARAGSH